MKVFLDDVRECPEGWLLAKTAKEAIFYLITLGITEISLDHDLGTEDTGYTVAEYIERGAYEKTLPRLTWHLHTDNPVGRAKMQAALTRADKYWSENEKNP
jgi:hypothetical protein